MSKKKKSKKGQKLTAAKLQTLVFNTLKNNPKTRFHARQLIKKLRIANSVDSVNHALIELAKDGRIAILDNGKYKFRKGSSFKEVGLNLKGIVDMTMSGAAFVICDNLDQDIYIPRSHVNGALNNDEVEVSLLYRKTGRRPEGKVVKIVKRHRESFIGTLYSKRNKAYVVPADPTIHFRIDIPSKSLNDARHGEKVVAKIDKWPGRNHRYALGYITAILGAEGDNDAEMKSILINAGFDWVFPQKVLKQSKAIAGEITKEEIESRRDMREVLTLTIDPVDAKDFDDALSLQHLDNGHIEIGVHIADVSHYVKPNTSLDKEAYLRSTSVYLVDRVVPMLPERLSNELCSLRPEEDKLTFSAVFTFDAKYKIVKEWFGRTVIHSNKRFTYEGAQELIVAKSTRKKYAKEIKLLNDIAHKLRKDRFKNGAIAFETDEVRIQLDEDGKPIGVKRKTRFDAHMLVEDFMLLANKAVAAFIQTKGKTQEIPFVYRIHDEPNQEKLYDLGLFASDLGVKLDFQSPKNTVKSINKLTEMAQSDEALKPLLPLAIRCMAKAEYNPNNIGHYGLGFDNYSHFTSPIRRYSDVLVHRLLARNLKRTFRTDKSTLEAQCKHISSQERNAVSAERESVKYKLAEYMSDQVGEVFEGRINGMIEKGIFVEISEFMAEGLVTFDKFGEPFDFQGYKAIAMRSKKVYKMGDAITVRVNRVDLAKRQIDLDLA